jgi:hypothetical protein
MTGFNQPLIQVDRNPLLILRSRNRTEFFHYVLQHYLTSVRVRGLLNARFILPSTFDSVLLAEFTSVVNNESPEQLQVAMQPQQH